MLIAEVNKSKFPDVSEFFTENTIVHALDNEKIEREREKCQSMTLNDKIAKGAIGGLKVGVRNVPILIAVTAAANHIFKTSVTIGMKLPPIFIAPVLIGGGIIFPIFEEVLFRGIGQNLIAGIQNCAKKIIPNCIQNTKAFQWLTSRSCRIISANAIFSLAHLLNAAIIGPATSAIQASCIFFMNPTMSILHETTDDIAAPIAAHVANNTTAFSVAILAGMAGC